MSIKILSNTTINKISAGEVIERPSSVVKELVENSIDAGATKIEIILEQAGKNLIIIRDNGLGMSKEELELAIQRHATSKLDEEDLLNINSFGFRGEALPSIGAISKFKITSKQKNSVAAYTLSINGGIQEKTTQAALDRGTLIEVRDLFFATPARLKFLRTDKTELAAITIMCKKIALSHPHIDFTLTHENKDLIKVREREEDFNKTLTTRITEIMGEEFLTNSSHVNFKRNDIELYGYTSIPTYNKAAAEEQFLFINNRPVKDKILNIALKVAYQDFLSRDRHAVSVLFLKLDPHLVDVNVHPAKTEVRFHDPNLIRSIFISAIKEALRSDGKRVSTTLSNTAIDYMKHQNASTQLAEPQYSGNTQFQMPTQNFTSNNSWLPPSARNSSKGNNSYIDYSLVKRDSINNVLQTTLKHEQSPNAKTESTINPELEEILITDQKYYLGAAKAQLHNTYIISQSQDSIIITDQHAAHERLGYEKIKEQIKKKGIIKQRLLIPEIIELSSKEKAELIDDNKNSLFDLGLSIEKFGENSIIVSEIPSLLGDINIIKLINDLADHLISLGENIALTELIEHVTETYACHYSIRSGRVLSIVEMNELLRQMENTDFSAQCNHGRPTYVELKLKDIEKLFGRR
ncbi:MAG: DNA mismatch repair endonuclease MutL [Rickettsiaceae bacterium]